jgi:uncharacterized membrane protein YsdA (DUF1294 family)
MQNRGRVQPELIAIDAGAPVLALAAVNLAVLVLYGFDKRRARLRRRRVRERTLLAAAVAGPFGALAGMLLFRHKIRKPIFAAAVPGLAALHVGVAIALVLLVAG